MLSFTFSSRSVGPTVSANCTTMLAPSGFVTVVVYGFPVSTQLWFMDFRFHHSCGLWVSDAHCLSSDITLYAGLPMLPFGEQFDLAVRR